jgi:hypothetical protein
VALAQVALELLLVAVESLQVAALGNIVHPARLEGPVAEAFPLRRVFLLALGHPRVLGFPQDREISPVQLL